MATHSSILAWRILWGCKSQTRLSISTYFSSNKYRSQGNICMGKGTSYWFLFATEILLGLKSQI